MSHSVMVPESRPRIKRRDALLRAVGIVTQVAGLGLGFAGCYAVHSGTKHEHPGAVATGRVLEGTGFGLFAAGYALRAHRKP